MKGYRVSNKMANTKRTSNDLTRFLLQTLLAMGGQRGGWGGSWLLENFHAIVFGVSHDNAAVAADGDATRFVEL
jgi:hypothetical protein